MPDVVQAAQRYRQKLRAEVAKLDEFLSFAEKLLKDNGEDVEPTLSGAEAKPATSNFQDDKSSSAPVSQRASENATTASASKTSERSFFQKMSPTSD